MADIRLVWGFLLNCFSAIFNAYTGSFILGSVFALFVFRKLVDLIKKVFV